LRFVDAIQGELMVNCCSVCIDVGIQLEVIMTL